MLTCLILCKNSTQYTRVRTACRLQKIKNISRSIVNEDGNTEYYVIAEKYPRTEIYNDYEEYRIVKRGGDNGVVRSTRRLNPGTR